MDAYFVVSLVVGVVSIVLAVVAIWHSNQSERKSLDNYNRTESVLAEITAKATVIENTVSNTQIKLVDTITDIARPRQETTEEMLLKALLPAMVQNPELLKQLAEISNQKPQRQKRI